MIPAMPARSWFLLLALPAITACSRQAPVTTAAEAPPVTVRVATVAAESVPVLVESPATVRPAERASIAAKLTGSVASFPHGLGTAVAAGDILITLSAPETEARVRQAQAQLAEAERNATRQRTLVSTGVNPADSLRDAEDRLRYAQAAAAEVEALLAYATVRAPFAGVITEKHVLPGDLATPGLPLLVLESTQHLRAEGTIPEKAAATLRPGAVVSVLPDDAAAAVVGSLDEISAAADAVSRSVLVKVSLPAGTVRSGQFVRLQVASGTAEALFVPADAVTRFGQMERVFVIQQNRAILRLVKTGRTTGGRVEILAGLNTGELVVLAPPAALRDSQPVIVQP